MMHGAWGAHVLAAVALGVTCSAPRAQSVADFYKGRTVDFIVGAAAGGGFDQASPAAS